MLKNKLNWKQPLFYLLLPVLLVMVFLGFPLPLAPPPALKAGQEQSEPAKKRKRRTAHFSLPCCRTETRRDALISMTSYPALPRAASLLAVLAALSFAQAARADDAADLVGLINAYRAAPGACGGRAAAPLPPLAANRALDKVRIGAGGFLHYALKQAGYVSETAEALYVQGANDAKGVMAVIRKQDCATLLGAQFEDVGVARNGGEWTIVLARPLVLPKMPAWPEAGQAVLAAVNAARAAERLCGDKIYPAAGPLSWNPALGNAAFAHSSDMAAHRFFNHRGQDGRFVADRAERAGYLWQAVGENIASGMREADQAVAEWLDSPGHCANIMNPRFTEMGAAWALNPDRDMVYWTQVLAAPR